MGSIISEKFETVNLFRPIFTEPTWRHFRILLIGLILTTGNKTLTNILRTLGFLAPHHWTTYHRTLSMRCCNHWQFSRILSQMILHKSYGSNKLIHMTGDDTVTQHPGKKVYGKCKHRDAVRSSHSYTAFRWGHKWVVLSIAVKVPWSQRPWSLPIMVALYRSRHWNEKHNKRHRTPQEIMKLLLFKLIKWFPERHFIISCDGGFGTHMLARFASKYSKKLTLVSRFPPNGNIHDLPEKQNKMGRPRKVGKKKLPPKEVVLQSQSKNQAHVNWYGGRQRQVAYVTGQGQWYKSGKR